MKNILQSVLLCLGPLCALSVSMDVDNLKTFSVVGKERPVLNGYGEAELLLHEGRGYLHHMWFGSDWPGYDKTVIRVRAFVQGLSSGEAHLVSTTPLLPLDFDAKYAAASKFPATGNTVMIHDNDSDEPSDVTQLREQIQLLQRQLRSKKQDLMELRNQVK